VPRKIRSIRLGEEPLSLLEFMNLTKKKLQFTPGVLTDLEQVMVIERMSFPYPWTEGMVRSELCGAPDSLSFVGRETERGPVLAYVFMRAFPDELHLLSIAVDPAWRRQGVGDALIALVLKTLHEQKLRRVTLEVRVSNRPACRLYRKFGFKEIGIRRQYYCKPTENGLVLQYDINPPPLVKAVGFRV
jgi:[ribosomal protein S18]-alanine N-acetyltransferase